MSEVSRLKKWVVTTDCDGMHEVEAESCHFEGGSVFFRIGDDVVYGFGVKGWLTVELFSPLYANLVDSFKHRLGTDRED